MKRWLEGRWRAAPKMAARLGAGQADSAETSAGGGGPDEAGYQPVQQPPMSQWLSDGVLLIGPDPDGTVAAIAIDLPVQANTVTVVSLLTNARDTSWLTEAIISAAPPGAAIRLAISNAAAAQGDEPAPAQRLAERLRVEVIAPDGHVLLTPGGTAFVAPPTWSPPSGGSPSGGTSPSAGAVGGRWLRFGLDGSVTPAGARFPEPSWAPAARLAATQVADVAQAEAATSGVASGGVATSGVASGGVATGGMTAGMMVAEVPAGLWVWARGGAVPPLDDLAFGVPGDPELCTLIVGRSGAAPLDPSAVVAALAGLPEELRGRLLLAPYGSGARASVTVAGELARRWGVTVYLANGLPVIGPDGTHRVLATDEAGTPLWWPMTRRMRCEPGRLPLPVDPPAELAGLPVVAERVWSLREPWLVELTHFGLWIRHRDLPTGVAQLTQIPWDPRWLTVVAGVPGQPADGIRPVLADLLARLPEAARGRVRMVSPELLSQLSSAGR